ncbi:peptidoglycan glycosyltransferase [Fulvivirga sp. RKSG066]|uniref:penicillin-binding transpeptidase domain-containing protein n=1 Tax=Fulvivirga aurantia TaxID=2529383 RepID=UPI0012BD54EA|nr:penicillin-binding transpeptidase domain-containing protein [Fulvivirga aurantia]MTI21014.1 peptidoglycan glycosyltransferase [Fulvivirga aurantia]
MNQSRRYIIQLVMILTGLIFLVKLFSIQVLDSKYAEAATSNIIHRVIEYPYRGLVFDRNGKLIVYNTPQYNLIVVPTEVKNLDTAKFCEVFNIEKEVFIEKMEEAKDFSYVQPSIFIKQLSNQDLAYVQDYIVDFPGFDIQPRTTRAYAQPIMANALGYVSEINKNQLKRDTLDYYRQGDYIGQSGLEAYYEKQLRGRRGVKFKVKNVRGIEKGPYEDGEYDTLSIPGRNLVSTIDLDLQAYGEDLLQGKSGSIVAIEPASGEILSLVSGPSYDPSLLTGRKYSQNFSRISSDTLKPLFNRPLMAQYRPGSIFKIIQAMVALQEGVINPSTRIVCNRSIIGCHGPHSFEDLEGAIKHSCNPYFHNVMRRVVNQGVSDDTYEDTRIGLAKWRKHVESFGLGSPLGIDLPNEKSGMVPSVEYYDRAYRGEPWKYSNIYSIAIGEGENLVVPLQMANFASIVANRGYYYIPHLVKSIGDNGSPLPKYQEKHYTSVDPKHFDVAVEAMASVVESGTGQYRAKLKDIVVCGKTGTVQNDPMPDHSVFIAFAPKDDPKIAVSVYVEDAGQGARAAASIASLMIEKYLLGATERPFIEEYVKKGEFLY